MDYLKFCQRAAGSRVAKRENADTKQKMVGPTILIGLPPTIVREAGNTDTKSQIICIHKMPKLGLSNTKEGSKKLVFLDALASLESIIWHD